MRKGELVQVVTEAAEVTDLRELGERVLPRLARAANATGALLYRYGEAGRLEPLGGSIAELMAPYARYYLHQDPVQVHPRKLAPEPRVVLATRSVDRKAFRRSAAYGEFYGPHELDHLACMWLTHLPYGAPGMTGLMLARSDRGGDFERDEQRALDEVLPALTAAAARAVRLRELDTQREALEAIASASGPRLVLSRIGIVVWASRTALELVPVTPAALRAAARRLVDGPRGPATVALDAGITAHLSIVRAASGEPFVLVELTGAAAAPSVDGLVAAHGLTRAEATVLAALAGGLSNAAIAERLAVSVETVRTHVKRILGKLGVRSRVQAAVMATRRN